MASKLLQFASEASVALDGGQAIDDAWNAWREGRAVRCTIDGGAVALAVSEHPRYRFVCTACGEASSWFDAAIERGVDTSRSPAGEEIAQPAVPWAPARTAGGAPSSAV